MIRRRRRVRRHADFEADFVRLLEGLVARGDVAWIANLSAGLRDVVRLLERVPGAGTLMEERGTLVMRRIIFRKGPYVAWYVYDRADRDGEVWLVRLFHARQRRPGKGMPRWFRHVRSRRS